MRRPYEDVENAMSTPVPPQDEPDIYQSLAAALMEASRGIRLANERGFDALLVMDRAIELTVNTPDMMRESRLLSQQAWDLREQARGLERGADERIEQANGLRRQADALIGRATIISEQIQATVLESRTLMQQSILELRAASEIHRVALERAATLMTSTRRPPTNGGNPDAAT